MGRILENLEEILESPQSTENKAESDHFFEILENLEVLEILEFPPAKRPLFVMTPFSGPDYEITGSRPPETLNLVSPLVLGKYTDELS